METSPVRILLADDHAVLRAGLRMLLSAEVDMEIVGEAGNGNEVAVQAQKTHPDIILLDLTMPETDGLTVLPRLHKIVPDAHILILTMHEDEAYLRQALQNGASGYVLKKAADVELLSAIRAVMRGEIYVHPAMTKLLLDGILPRSAEPISNETELWERLSEREQQVVEGIVHGYTSEGIADTYHLSVKTVYTYRSRAMAKLGIETRAKLVDFALRLGILGANL